MGALVGKLSLDDFAAELGSTVGVRYTKDVGSLGLCETRRADWVFSSQWIRFEKVEKVKRHSSILAKGACTLLTVAHPASSPRLNRTRSHVVSSTACTRAH